MVDGFPGAKLIGQRTEEEILEESGKRKLKEAERHGFNPIDGKSWGFELQGQSASVESEVDVNKYLEGFKNLQPTELVLRAEDNRSERPRQLREDLNINLDFDNSRFLRVYSQAAQELDIESAAFGFVGYGENPVEAYENAAPELAMKIEGERNKSFTASYRHGETVIESIWAEDQEDFREIYDALQETDAVYRGAVLEGNKEGEWMISDYGAEEPSEIR